MKTMLTTWLITSKLTKTYRKRYQRTSRQHVILRQLLNTPNQVVLPLSQNIIASNS